MNKTMYFSTPVLPWDRSAEEERRFRKLAAVFAVIFLILSVVMAFYPLPEKKREQIERVPPRLAKMVMERQQVPPPPPPPPKEEPKKEEPKPEEVKKEEPKKEEPKKEEPKKEEVKPVTSARERARAHMAVFDDLADLRDKPDLSALQTEQNAAASTAGSGTLGEPTQRSLIGTNAIGGSGGVAVAKASSGGGGTGSLSGSGNVGTTQVESSIVNPAAQQAERRSASGKSRRTTEDVQLVFDRNKGGIYSLYRRALRQNPGLEGTLVLRLEIQPDGSVTRCDIVSSELKDADLERKIVARIRQINFGKLDVEVWRETYPISFIPS